uniref:Poly [ADP-ribose] polymerase n=1 Tax=Fagus sylvatica TaxID=28930 RepID=A0A2N9EGW1_FAGSY
MDSSSSISLATTNSNDSTTITQQTLLFSLSDLSKLITVKLDQSSYILWKCQITSVLDAYSLLNFVDGSQPCPSRENPLYQQWFARDRTVLMLIHSTLSHSALSLVIGQSTAHGAWEVIDRHYTSVLRSNMLNLKAELYNIEKNNDSISLYLQRIKEIRDKACGQGFSQRPICQICGRIGHIALDCFHRMDFSYQGKQPPSKLAAMASTPGLSSTQFPTQSYWVLDIGAMYHYTLDLDTISDHQDYKGYDLVTVGNGQSLPILHIADEEESESKEEKIVTATKKGSAVLDQCLPDHIKAHYHGDDIYDAMLNQTNVGENNNKFYVIQALESDSGGTFMVYNRKFEQKFFAKTKNQWCTRKEFICHPKSYTWLEMDYSVKEKESDVKNNPNSTLGIQPRETQLEERIAKFISLVCNVSMMRQQMMEIGYNANKLPLGKLSKSTIMKVEALAEIEVATKLLEDHTGIEDDPLYSHYKRLHCELTPLGVDSKEFSMVIASEVLHSLRVAPPEAPVTGYMFGKGVYFADMFSKSANYCYATRAAKAGVLLLCEVVLYPVENIIVIGKDILLGWNTVISPSVALGDMAELVSAKYDADKLPKGKLSTKGVGHTAPDLSEAQTLEDGVVVPLGRPKERLSSQGGLLYNEYIVYNADQIRMRYVIQVNFNYK